MSSIKQFQVTFDCAEPERVARFWCEVLGYVVPPPPKGFSTWDDFNRSQLDVYPRRACCSLMVSARLTVLPTSWRLARCV
ncbi:VOC family protein, partial [Streptomyces acidicola]|uniref:VOC family protein n=1 Tax=Streptomyces acidicola TaxID=2596892 RepID=UPI0034442AFD